MQRVIKDPLIPGSNMTQEASGAERGSQSGLNGQMAFSSTRLAEMALARGLKCLNWDKQELKTGDAVNLIQRGRSGEVTVWLGDWAADGNRGGWCVADEFLQMR